MKTLVTNWQGRLQRGSRFLSATLAVIFGVLCSTAFAENFSSTDIEAFYTTQAKTDPGTGTGTSNEKLLVTRFEHFGTWNYGDNYIDLDWFHGSTVGGQGAGSFGSNTSDSYFLVYVPRISFSKTLGFSMGDGFVKDIYVAYRLERASYANFHSNNIGFSVDLKVPGTAFFEQDFYMRQTNFDKGNKFLSRTVWLAPFQAGPIAAHFDGLLLVKTTDSSGTDFFSQLDLLADLTPKGGVQAGLRYEYHHSKDYSRSTPYLMLKWNL